MLWPIWPQCRLQAQPALGQLDATHLVRVNHMQEGLPLCLLCMQPAAVATFPRCHSRYGAWHCLFADALLEPQKDLLPWPHTPVYNTLDITTSMVHRALPTLPTLLEVDESVKVHGNPCTIRNYSCPVKNDRTATCAELDWHPT
jgi:hypothetical protein